MPPITVAFKSAELKALVWSPSQFWDGPDGPWFTFSAQFGLNPNGDQTRRPEPLRLIPSTSLAQSYLIRDEGCTQFANYTFANNKPCADSRGRLYNPGASFNVSSKMETDASAAEVWSLYNLTKVYADAYIDSISIPTDDRREEYLSDVPIAAITNPLVAWVGLLGIDPKVTNYTLGSAPNDGQRLPRDKGIQKSMLDQLKYEGIIGSLTWAYHAGSWSRPAESGWGSLVLGGWDASRLKATPKIEFDFSKDVEVPHKLSVLGMTYGTGGSNTLQEKLMAPGTYSYSFRVDSTRPYLYFPQPICDALATKFNLKWGYGHYLIDQATHAENLKKKAYLEFDLAPHYAPQYINNGAIPPTVPRQKLRVSYESLVLKLSFPLAPKGVEPYYFPIQNATNDAIQLVLGRAFLQDIYLISNYERKNFVLGEIEWSRGETSQQADIRPIPADIPMSMRPAYLCVSDECKSKDPVLKGPGGKMSTIQIAGIVIGVVALLSIIACFLFFRNRRNKARAAAERAAAAKEKSEDDTSTGTELDSSPISPGSPDKVHEMETIERDIAELEDKTIAEMPDASGTLAGYYKEAELDGSPATEIFEMEGSPVTPLSPDRKAPLPPDIRVYGEEGSGGSILGPLPGDLGHGDMPPPPYASPIPQTPSEYYGRHARRRFGFSSADIKRSHQTGIDAAISDSRLSAPEVADNRPPASAIPQTPLEYYGSRVPEHRLRQAVGQAMLLGPQTAQKKNEETKRDSSGGLQVPSTDARGRSSDAESSTAQVSSPDQMPASPIPQTPLEMYGRVPASVGSAQQRNWVGRAPEVPSVNLIPATPNSPSVPAVPQVPLRSAAREMRPPERSPERNSSNRAKREKRKE